ncbi:hypothetical protein CAPN008_05830 [Capnocytophaga canis]|uniref:hypothetical protein n=1 Tax=Capnocytophaga canis TaxID=1848903 RepID=UPI001AC83294|nr:hypothetical protein [Capnocytophaga canis]GIM60533.1 hypothetical protein CAPN008_05830 [Capnocytophaga canis]
MKIIEIQRKPVDFKEYIKRSAKETDYKTLITEPCLITENGEPKILYINLDKEKTKYLRQACKNIRYEKSERTTGLKTQSRIFGYSPRNTIRKDFCSSTSMAVEHPLEHSVICDFGEYIAGLYEEYFPEIYNKHKDLVVQNNLDEWKIPRTPFTSGIVNKNNPLKYHFDAGNISDVLSNMIVFKKNMQGGYLACPEFDIAFECADNTAVLFDGQKILHGVTPLNKNEKSYRYSVVYYSLKQMWNCLPLTEEIIRAREVRNKRETKRANGEVNINDLQLDR